MCILHSPLQRSYLKQSCTVVTHQSVLWCRKGKHEYFIFATAVDEPIFNFKNDIDNYDSLQLFVSPINFFACDSNNQL